MKTNKPNLTKTALLAVSTLLVFVLVLALSHCDNRPVQAKPGIDNASKQYPQSGTYVSYRGDHLFKPLH